MRRRRRGTQRWCARGSADQSFHCCSLERARRPPRCSCTLRPTLATCLCLLCVSLAHIILFGHRIAHPHSSVSGSFCAAQTRTLLGSFRSYETWTVQPSQMTVPWIPGSPKLWTTLTCSTDGASIDVLTSVPRIFTWFTRSWPRTRTLMLVPSAQ